MDKVILAITEWPIIVQGALGSALFWLVFICIQKGIYFTSRALSTTSKRRRKSWIVNRRIKLHGYTVGDRTISTQQMIALKYRSLRNLYKSIMWLCSGLIVNSFTEGFGIIGFIGSLYYISMAVEIVSPVNLPREEALNEYRLLSKELDEIEAD